MLLENGDMEVNSIMIAILTSLAVFSFQVSASSNEDGVRVGVSEGDTFGRVEVHSMGMWLPICDDDWTILDATVVCRQLELGIFGLPVIDETFDYGEKHPIRVTRKCLGYEERLQDCIIEHRRSDCGYSPKVGVLCNPKMRLDGSSYSDSHEGHLRLLQPYQNKWILVKDNSLLDPKIATEICLELGLGFAGSISSSNDDFDISSGDDDTDIIPDYKNHPVVSCISGRPETSPTPDNQTTSHHNPVVTSILIIVILSIIIIAAAVAFLFFKLFLLRRSEGDNCSTDGATAFMPLTPVTEEARYDVDPTNKAANQAKTIEEKGQTTSDSVYECPDSKPNAPDNGQIYEMPNESLATNQNATSNIPYQNCKIGPIS